MMQNNQNLEEQIKEIISKILHKRKEEINPESKIFEDLGADSLTAVEILSNIDKKFNLDLPEEELAEIETFSQLVKFVRRELEKNFSRNYIF